MKLRLRGRLAPRRRRECWRIGGVDLLLETLFVSEPDRIDAVLTQRFRESLELLPHRHIVDGPRDRGQHDDVVAALYLNADIAIRQCRFLLDGPFIEPADELDQTAGDPYATHAQEGQQIAHGLNIGTQKPCFDRLDEIQRKANIEAAGFRIRSDHHPDTANLAGGDRIQSLDELAEGQERGRQLADLHLTVIDSRAVVNQSEVVFAHIQLVAQFKARLESSF